MKNTMIWPVVATILLVGCGAPVEDDPTAAEAERAPSLDGKADGIGIYGNYQLSEILSGGPASAAGDLISLSLFEEFDRARTTPPPGSAGAYARVRAYDGGAELAMQSDTFRLFTSGGKKYIEFRGFTWISQDRLKTVVEDVYEYKRAGKDLKLRKTYTSRWQLLSAISDEDLCGNSGGTWDPSNPQEGARTDSSTACSCAEGKVFVPGAGGCMVPLITDEGDCSDTRGYYTDDDATYLGNYCICPSGSQLTTDGCKKIQP